MPHRSEPMFVVGLAEGGTPPQHHLTVSHAPVPIPASAAPTTSTTSTMNHLSPQERDAALLRELASNTVSKALAALQANNPGEAAAALRAAHGYADRWATAHNALEVVNIRKTNPYHGYDLNAPMAGTDAHGRTPGLEYVTHLGGYDLNRPEGK